MTWVDWIFVGIGVACIAVTVWLCYVALNVGRWDAEWIAREILSHSRKDEPE